MTKEELKQYIDDNIYENPDGEITGESLNAVLKAIVEDAGTEVEANPTGEATDTLNKIKIGETNYNIPQTDTSNLVTEQELAEELIGYVQRTDPPSPAADNLVAFNEYGGFGDSGKKVTDFATRAQGEKADTAVQPAALESLATKQELQQGLNGKQDTISDLEQIRTRANEGHTALQPNGVKTINNQSIVGSGNITIEGGGTNVEANPQGAATATLSKLKIGETIYTAPQGEPGVPGADGQDGQPGPANTLTIGTVTDGEQAAASITGDAPSQTLNLVLPKGEKGDTGQNAVNPFKGWWPDLATLKSVHTATAGDSAYVKDASPATTWSIYVYDSTASSDNYWADSGLDADTSHAQTFASGEEVNGVRIVNDFNTGGYSNIANAEIVRQLHNMYVEVFGGEESTTLEGTQLNYPSSLSDPYSTESDPLTSPYIDVHSYEYPIHVKKIIINCISLGNAGSTNNFLVRCCTPAIYTKYKVPRTSYGPVLDVADFISLGAITLQVGLNEIDVDYILPQGYHLVFGNNPASGGLTFGYDLTTVADGFCYFTPPNAASHAGTSRFLDKSISISYEYDYNVSSYTSSKVREAVNSVLMVKKLSILGDSISTFSGYIPSGNAVYYPHSGIDVNSVTDTWWKKVIDALELTLEVNNSWSGSYVTTNNGNASSAVYSRCEDLGQPDIIFFYMGINDFNHEVQLGTYDGNTALPTSTTTFREAYAITLNKILTKYKRAKLYCFTLIAEEQNGDTGFPEINGNGNTIKQFNAAIKDIADAFGVEVIDLAKCGMTYQNMSVYNPNLLHPNKDGHSVMANYVIKQMDNAVNTRY